VGTEGLDGGMRVEYGNGMGRPSNGKRFVAMNISKGLVPSPCIDVAPRLKPTAYSTERKANEDAPLFSLITNTELCMQCE